MVKNVFGSVELFRFFLLDYVMLQDYVIILKRTPQILRQLDLHFFQKIYLKLTGKVDDHPMLIINGEVSAQNKLFGLTQIRNRYAKLLPCILKFL